MQLRSVDIQRAVLPTLQDMGWRTSPGRGSEGLWSAGRPHCQRLHPVRFRSADVIRQADATASPHY